MNLFIPKGQRFYHTFFRVRDRSKASGWRQVMRSCQTVDAEPARQRAAEIFLEEVAKSSAAQKTMPIAESEACPIVEDPTIEDLIAHHKVWMTSALPGEIRPSLSTAHNYYLRIRQLARLLRVRTVSELAGAMKGLTAQNLDVSEENYTPLIRNAAGIFRQVCMRYYSEKGMVFEVPIKSGPRVLFREFTTPPKGEQLERLKKAAETELRPTLVRDYLMFLLMLHGGLRAQEAAHVQWRHVGEDGIWVHEEGGSCSVERGKQRWRPKAGKNRLVPVGKDILAKLNAYRRLPLEFVVGDEAGPGKIAGYVPKTRASRVCRRLAKWLRQTLPDLLADESNPLHWLRKVFGSVVADVAGVPTAGAYLGHVHGSPVTAQVYVGILRRDAVAISIHRSRRKQTSPWGTSAIF